MDKAKEQRLPLSALSAYLITKEIRKMFARSERLLNLIWNDEGHAVTQGEVWDFALVWGFNFTGPVIGGYFLYGDRRESPSSLQRLQ
jgi:hypothetical protein